MSSTVVKANQRSHSSPQSHKTLCFSHISGLVFSTFFCVCVCPRIYLVTKQVVLEQLQQVPPPLEVEVACLETSLHLHWGLIQTLLILVSLFTHHCLNQIGGYYRNECKSSWILSNGETKFFKRVWIKWLEIKAWLI